MEGSLRAGSPSQGIAKEGAVHSQYHALKADITELEATIESLINRLTPALHPEGPIASGGHDQSAKPTHPVPMAEGLILIRERVKAVCYRIQSAVERLEI